MLHCSLDYRLLRDTSRGGLRLSSRRIATHHNLPETMTGGSDSVDTFAVATGVNCGHRRVDSRPVSKASLLDRTRAYLGYNQLEAAASEGLLSIETAQNYKDVQAARSRGRGCGCHQVIKRRITTLKGPAATGSVATVWPSIQGLLPRPANPSLSPD